MLYIYISVVTEEAKLNSSKMELSYSGSHARQQIHMKNLL